MKDKMSCDNKNKTSSSIYLMHKYWGKKPADELKKIIEKYTKVGDLILDPFSGFGGIGIEGILLNRDVILNDLNPIANYISKCILNTEIDLEKFKKLSSELKIKYTVIEKEWYFYKDFKIISILRDKEDNILKLKIKNSSNKFSELELPKFENEKMLEKENKYKVKNWFPTTKLIENSRIGAKKNMKINDLFSKRELICQSFLYNLINKLEESNEKELLKFAFTSNLANCSKLVPPISSRGEMSQGAWMTGFYVGNKYLENNVFHYFENRVNKILKGKADYLKIYKNNTINGEYKITNFDAKKLPIDDNTIDFIFTDFPYGDTVPYFEQSQIWNMWLKNKVDYRNEIIVSDSKERKKDIISFKKDIEKSISEIFRVLKENSYFVFTFHSIEGDEWNAILNAIIKFDFKFIECSLLIQKTLTPRQLNRKIIAKGDLVVVYQKIKNTNKKSLVSKSEKDIILEIKKQCDFNNLYDTNELLILCIKTLLKSNSINEDIDFVNIISENFIIDEKSNKWRLK